MKIVTCIAPVNIAVIKYWGKSNEELIIPINDSLSGTLSTDFMCAKTTIMASPLLKENKFWLNGKEQSFDNKRLKSCLKEVKRRADPDLPELKWKISICSENNFPTAAGLASSAAGYACLVYTLTALYGIEGDISSIARRGSGSACRSIYGGWVQWCKGSNEQGLDSLAKQIVPASHWPEMRVLILVVNDTKKKYSSTDGMKRSVETSELLKYRAQEIVPKRIELITKAIQEKDFQTFAQITMEDSNQFHAVCLDTFPPCVYMNDTSHAVAEMVHAYNDYKSSNRAKLYSELIFCNEENITESLITANMEICLTKVWDINFPGIPQFPCNTQAVDRFVHLVTGASLAVCDQENRDGFIQVAYTFDAGPNACLYILASEVEEFISVINYIFPPGIDTVEYLRGIPLSTKPIIENLKLALNIKQYEVGSLKYIIHTKIGNGPQILSQEDDHLLNSAGIPKIM